MFFQRGHPAPNTKPGGLAIPHINGLPNGMEMKQFKASHLSFGSNGQAGNKNKVAPGPLPDIEVEVMIFISYFVDAFPHTTNLQQTTLNALRQKYETSLFH